MSTTREAQAIAAALQSAQVTPAAETRGRKPLALQVPAEPAFDDEKIDSATHAMREQAQQDQLELLELASDVGAIRALEMTRNLVAAATVRLFQKISDSKKIKDLPIRQSDGSVATATNLDEFCRLAFGKTRSAMFEASATLEALGEQAYEAANRLGLNRSTLRLTRALPPEKLEVVRTAIAGGSTRAEVLSVIEDLAEKVQQAEAATAEAVAATAEAVAENEAIRTVLEKKNQRIDQLERAQERIAKLPPDEELEKLQQEATTHLLAAQGAIRGQLRAALIALQNHADDNSTFMAGMVGQLMADLTLLRDEFNLPSLADGAQPEWQRWAAAQGAGAAQAN